MKLHSIFILHKWLGLSLGSILLLLGLSGFFLNHDGFRLLWDIRISDTFLPNSISQHKQSGFTSYKIDANNPQHIMAGSRMGLFVSWDGGQHFQTTLAQQVLAIEPEQTPTQQNFQILYTATSTGIYRSTDGGMQWQIFALAGKNVESLTHFNGQLFAVVDKHDVWQVNTTTQVTQALSLLAIPQAVLPTEISLGRLVRDLHYGRGLFDSDLSLYINDASAILLVFFGVSGWVIFLSIRRIRTKKTVNRPRFKVWVKTHSHGIMLWTILPILLLLVTGIFLDHSKAFQSVLNQTKLNTAYLPPVYRSLQHDIWGFDFDGTHYRLGNRLGVFKSTDLQHWSLDSAGFAYQLKRVGSQLVVCGMGAPSRVLTATGWQVLSNAPHMPRDVYQQQGAWHYLNMHDHSTLLPTTNSTPLYWVLLGLHDGSLLAEQWVWVNDAAVLAALLLFITGFIKWRRKHTR